MLCNILLLLHSSGMLSLQITQNCVSTQVLQPLLPQICEQQCSCAIFTVHCKSRMKCAMGWEASAAAAAAGEAPLLKLYLLHIPA